MPFTSKAQARFIFARMPKKAKEWAEKTPSIKSLPEKVNKKRSSQLAAVKKKQYG